jgi:hypothetical protein
VSTTVTVWLQTAELPHASVARQVRVALKVSPHAALVTVPTIAILFVPQVSVAVGLSNVQGAPH